MAGRPAKLPGTVKASLTYVSTGDRWEMVDSSGAGPVVVGQRIISHLVWNEVHTIEWRIFRAEKTLSNEY